MSTLISSVKDSFFSPNYTINCRGKLIDLSTPLVMGILNTTPDSFFDGGKHNEITTALSFCEQMINDGAAIIDIGAVSTRPGSQDVPQEEELSRLTPIIKAIRKEFPEIIISIDTYRSGIARAMYNEGADIINDISGGTMDDAMFKTIADIHLPYILMHIKGTPSDMQQNPQYEDITKDVFKFLGERISTLRSMGVQDIIIDPGFGFGKTLEHNYQLMAEMDILHTTGCPILVGISRKSMICRLLDIKPSEALNGTTVLNTIALLHGASILRVHDVKQAIEAVKIVEKIKVKSEK